MTRILAGRPELIAGFLTAQLGILNDPRFAST